LVLETRNVIFCEQDLQILKLLRLRERIIPNPERTVHLFLVENHGLGFEIADFHPGDFTLSFKPLQYTLKVLA